MEGSVVERGETTPAWMEKNITVSVTNNIVVNAHSVSLLIVETLWSPGT